MTCGHRAPGAERGHRSVRRVGYSTPVLWYGSLADSGPLSTKQIVAQGRTWFLPAHLVIGHANHAGTIGALPRLQRILEQRHLGTFTLHDVFATRSKG